MWYQISSSTQQCSQNNEDAEQNNEQASPRVANPIVQYSAQWSSCQLGCSCSQNFPCKLGSCYRSILSEIRVWKSQKNNISHGCFDLNTLRQIFLEIAWQNWHFRIGLSLFDSKLDNGNIVHWMISVMILNYDCANIKCRHFSIAHAKIASRQLHSNLSGAEKQYLSKSVCQSVRDIHTSPILT